MASLQGTGTVLYNEQEFFSGQYTIDERENLPGGEPSRRGKLTVAGIGLPTYVELVSFLESNPPLTLALEDGEKHPIALERLPDKSFLERKQAKFKIVFG